jgi:SOS-response transcriptional repressor LexA
MELPISFQSVSKSSLFLTKKRDSRLIPSGFPAASDDYSDKILNLHELMVKNTPSTFFMKVENDDFKFSKCFEKRFTGD